MDSLGGKIFNLDFNSTEPEPGTLLVAEPFMKQEPFNHSVIYLADFNKADNTVLGLVLNKPTELSMRMATPSGESIGPAEGIRLFNGGPVDHDRLFYLHTLGPEVIKDAVEIADGIYLNGRLSDVFEYLGSGYPVEGYIKFFKGYSGWGIDQLQQEMERKTWTVAKVDDPQRLLEANYHSMWHDTVKSLGEQYRNWLFHPLDPDMN